jgi:hypothetical protein
MLTTCAPGTGRARRASPDDGGSRPRRGPGQLLARPARRTDPTNNRGAAAKGPGRHGWLEARHRWQRGEEPLVGGRADLPGRVATGIPIRARGELAPSAGAPLRCRGAGAVLRNACESGREAVAMLSQDARPASPGQLRSTSTRAIGAVPPWPSLKSTRGSNPLGLEPPRVRGGTRTLATRIEISA